MAKNKGITVEKLALIASVRNYVVDVIASGVACGTNNTLLHPDSQKRLAEQERAIIDQIEKIDGNK